MNWGKELKDERAVQDYHLAPRGCWPAGEVVPHLAAACGVKAEGTCHQMSIVRTLFLLFSLEGPLSERRPCLLGGCTGPVPTGRKECALFIRDTASLHGIIHLFILDGVLCSPGWP